QDGRGATAAPGRAFYRRWRRSPCQRLLRLAGKFQGKPQLCAGRTNDPATRRERRGFTVVLIPGLIPIHADDAVFHARPDSLQVRSDLEPPADRFLNEPHQRIPFAIIAVDASTPRSLAHRVASFRLGPAGL